MKYTLILSLLLTFIQPAFAGPDDVRTRYYNTGMAASIHYYDSVLQRLVADRTNGRLTESVFLTGYTEAEGRYRKHQEIVALLANRWSELEQPGKLIRSTLQLVEAGKPGAAIELIKAKRKEKITTKTKAEYRLLSELYLMTGDFRQSSSSFQAVTNSGAATVEDRLYNITVLYRNGKFGEAIEQNRQLAKSLGDDTLALIRAELQLSEIYKAEKANNLPLTPLVNAQYLLQKMRTSGPQRELLARVLIRMATIQLDNNDFDNAFRNAKSSVTLYDAMGSEALPSETADVSFVLARICKRAGANKEADTFYQKTLMFYRTLAMVYPQLYEPKLAVVLDEYSEVKKWFDKDEEYDQMLRESLAVRKKMMEQTKYPFFKYDYAYNAKVLAQKLMNVNVKLTLAEEQWVKSRDVLELLFVHHPLLAGDELCSVYYKLAGAKSAVKRADEAYAIFLQSLTVREYLYKLAPSQNAKDLATVLVQTANFEALKKDFKKAIEKVGRAELLAKEAGDERQVQEIVKFKEILQKQL